MNSQKFDKLFGAALAFAEACHDENTEKAMRVLLEAGQGAMNRPAQTHCEHCGVRGGTNTVDDRDDSTGYYSDVLLCDRCVKALPKRIPAHVRREMAADY